MKIFRDKKNGKLYTIEFVRPRLWLGQWHEATPYLHQGKTRKHINMKQFELVSER